MSSAVWTSWLPKWLARWSLRSPERRALLLLGDVLAVLGATLLALWLWTFTSKAVFSWAYLIAYWRWFYALVPAWMLLNIDLYNLRTAASWPATVRGLLWTTGIAVALYLGIFFFAPRGLLPRLVVLYFILGTFVFCLAWRRIYVTVFVSPHFRQRGLVVGAGWAGKTMVRALAEFQPQQYTVMGLIDDDQSKHGQMVSGVPVLGGHESLLPAVQAYRVSEVVLAINGEIHGAMFQALLDCRAQGVRVVRMTSLYEQITGRAPIEDLNADWIVASFMDEAPLSNWFHFFKRMLDLAGAGIGLILLSFMLPFIAAAVRMESGGPIFYRQVRLGQGGRPFKMLKFRTMIQKAEADGQPRWASPDDERITRVGWFLRRSRLDEAPQLWHVLKGEMSLVGPRPERPEFISVLENKIPFYRARLLVKPGITGWAQINYGYGATVADAAVKLQWDLYYIKHQSFWLDLMILMRTVGVVLSFKGT